MEEREFLVEYCGQWCQCDAVLDILNFHPSDDLMRLMLYNVLYYDPLGVCVNNNSFWTIVEARNAHDAIINCVEKMKKFAHKETLVRGMRYWEPCKFCDFEEVTEDLLDFTMDYGMLGKCGVECYISDATDLPKLHAYTYFKDEDGAEYGPNYESAVGKIPLYHCPVCGRKLIRERRTNDTL